VPSKISKRATSEFRWRASSYHRVTEQALREDAAHHRVASGDDDVLTRPEQLPIDSFPAVKAVIPDDLWSAGDFHQGYRQSKNQIQAWLDELAKTPKIRALPSGQV